MKLVAAALRSEPGDPARNIRALVDCLTRYAGEADAVFACEAFVQGFDDLMFDPARDRARCLALDSSELATLRRAVDDTGVAAGYGYFERDGDAIYSSYAVDLPGGDAWPVYRRISRGWRPSDSDGSVYREGAASRPTTWCGKRVAVAMCGDLWSDLDAFAGLDVDLLLWPVYVAFSPERWRSELPAYAEQCRGFGCPVLLINGVNPAPANPSYGGAALFQGGEVVATAGFDGTEQELVVTL